jgi:hypothetical protein
MTYRTGIFAVVARGSTSEGGIQQFSWERRESGTAPGGNVGVGLKFFRCDSSICAGVIESRILRW